MKLFRVINRHSATFNDHNRSGVDTLQLRPVSEKTTTTKEYDKDQNNDQFVGWKIKDVII